MYACGLCVCVWMCMWPKSMFDLSTAAPDTWAPGSHRHQRCWCLETLFVFFWDNVALNWTSTFCDREKRNLWEKKKIRWRGRKCSLLHRSHCINYLFPDCHYWNSSCLLYNAIHSSVSHKAPSQWHSVVEQLMNSHDGALCECKESVPLSATELWEACMLFHRCPLSLSAAAQALKEAIKKRDILLELSPGCSLHMLQEISRSNGRDYFLYFFLSLWRRHGMRWEGEDRKGGI